MINIADALISLYSGKDWQLIGTTYDGLDWKDTNTEKPTEQELLSEVKRLQAEYDAKQYQRDRAKEYPTLQEQLDMQYWDSVNGTTVWQDTINAIKAKYPKVG